MTQKFVPGIAIPKINPKTNEPFKDTAEKKAYLAEKRAEMDAKWEAEAPKREEAKRKREEAEAARIAKEKEIYTRVEAALKGIGLTDEDIAWLLDSGEPLKPREKMKSRKAEQNDRSKQI